MGYLAQFDNDLFISYRRVANDPRDKWVDSFRDELLRSLQELVGPDVKIWRDADELVGGDAWRAKLHRAIAGSAIFLALISRSYLGQTECLRELDDFLGVMRANGKARKLLPVFKQPPDPKTPPPPELDALQRYQFFEWSPPGTPRWRELTPDEREFYAALGRLAQDIMFALQEIEGTLATLGDVFVARARPELEQQRERLRADLRQRRWNVLPAREYLWNAADIQEQMNADLRHARLCVHLLSDGASTDPESVAHEQAQLEAARAAMQAAGRPPPLVWIERGAGGDAASQALIARVEGEWADQGIEFVDGSLEELKTLVVDKLGAAAPAADAGVPEVALIVEDADAGRDAVLRALLADRLHVEPRRLKLLGTQPGDGERMKRVLAECGKAIVLWAGQREDWLDDVLSLPELAGHRGRDRLAVWVAEPASTEKDGYASARASVLRDEAALRAFLGLH